VPIDRLTVRPKVAELVFRLYGRPLHPELFEVHSSRTVKRGGYQAKIDITSTGHVMTWRYAGLTLTEVVTSARPPLPERRRLMSYRLKGERHDNLECRGGVTYDAWNSNSRPHFRAIFTLPTLPSAGSTTA